MECKRQGCETGSPDEDADTAMQVLLSSISHNLSILMMGENLIIACCYTAISIGISYGIWRNRQAGISPVVVTVAAIFLSCALGHGMHSLSMLKIPNVLGWQTSVDLLTVVVAVRFLSFYESFDVLAQISQIAASKAQLESQNKLLQSTIDKLQQAQSQLVEKALVEAQNERLQAAIEKLQQTQAQLVQAEKMSGLGQLVAGVAHEINNPVTFIAGNLQHVQEYASDLLSLICLYEQIYPQPLPQIAAEAESIDLPFLQEDLPKLLSSMNMGTERIRQIVLSLRNFSRMDEAVCKAVDIHEGIDSTLLILQHRLQSPPRQQPIELIKEYGDLPLVECYAGQLNQVFMNVLTNAIDALDKATDHRFETAPEQICIRTTAVLEKGWIEIAITDSGPGMTQSVIDKIFDPFFTTKPVGKGTGIGLSISYQIITERHQGKFGCDSQPGEGTEFSIQIPIRQDVVAPLSKKHCHPSWLSS